MNIERKILNLGYTITNGPIAIYRPGNDLEWYEQDVFIKIKIVGVRNNINQILGYESISIWTDNTMNKEENFFTPIIRYAKWMKINDLDKIRERKKFSFPSVKILLGDIKEKDSLETELLNFQELIKHLPYIPSGLSLKRDVPDIKYDNNFTAFSIFFRNGAQSIEFNSEPLFNDKFTKKVFSIFNIIKKHMKTFNNKGWIEKYNIDFSTLINTGYYKWDYTSKF